MDMTELDNNLDALIAAVFAGVALIVTLLFAVSVAKYTDLRQQAQQACASAAAPLDLSSWVPLCKEVGK